MDIKDALIQYNTAMDTLEDAEKLVQAALLNIKTTAKSATVDVDGQFFQVRERKDKLYLCELTGKPRGRPVGSKNTKPRKDKKSGSELAAELGSTTALIVQAEADLAALSESTGALLEIAEAVVEATAPAVMVDADALIAAALAEERADTVEQNHVTPSTSLDSATA